MALKGEIAYSLSKCHSLFPEISNRIAYSTLVSYSSKHSQFPKPYSKTLAGKGLTWYPSEIIEFLKKKADNRGIKKDLQITKGFRDVNIMEPELCNHNACRALIPMHEERIVVYPPNKAEKKYHLDCAKYLGIEIA